MIVLEFKLKGKAEQYRVIDEMIRTAQFVRNKTLRYWIDNQGVSELICTNNAPLWQKSLNGQASLTQWHVRLLPNVPFLLSNVFSLIAKQKHQAKKATQSLRSILALSNTKHQDGYFLPTKDV